VRGASRSSAAMLATRYFAPKCLPSRPLASQSKAIARSRG
jgi:hypothetical protein